jgi:hypothetical protein
MPRRNLFRAEDVLLGLVNLVAPTTLHVGLDRSDDPSAGLGLVLLLALLGAVAAIGLRPADQPSPRAGCRHRASSWWDPCSAGCSWWARWPENSWACPTAR